MRPLLLMIAALSASPALAADDVCPVDDPRAERTGTELLRAISLDLRGVVPTPEEYARVGDDGTLPDSLIDGWLASEAFADRTARDHRALLWNNLSGTRYYNTLARLSRVGNRWYRRNLAPRRRGDRVPCGDWENALDEHGRPVELRRVDGLIDDGWIEVTPYWAPETPIKVCTLDALALDRTPRGTDCQSFDAIYDMDCGCGPDLSWCAGYGVDEVINEAFSVDVDRRVRDIVLEDRPYTDLLTGTTAWVNGPLVHFLGESLGTANRLRMEHTPYDPAALPDLDWTDTDTWVKVDLGPEHAGVLTSPAYLLRFQTDRARATRFTSAFLCEDFQAPPGGLPAEDGVPTLDLTARDGCKYCHALLEPAAAHWGRWSETGASYLDPATFPDYDAACARCAEEGIGCDRECRYYYVTDPLNGEEEPYTGQLAAFKFLDARHHHHVAQGPRLLVQQGLADRRLPECVARRTAERLLGRELGPADEPWLQDLTDRFAGSDYSYRELVETVVTSPNYRRRP